MKKYKIYLKYVASGIIGLNVDVGCLYFFTNVLGIWYLFSAAIVSCIVFFVSFYLQKFWTFRDKSKCAMHQQMLKYLAIGLLNLLLNLIGIYILVEKFNIYYLIAQLMVCSVIGIESFFIYKLLIFKCRINTRKRENDAII